MLLFGVTIPATVPQRSEIPEGLMNYPVFGKRKTKEYRTIRCYIRQGKTSSKSGNVFEIFF
jgi:hypothetical protein